MVEDGGGRAREVQHPDQHAVGRTAREPEQDVGLGVGAAAGPGGGGHEGGDLAVDRRAARPVQREHVGVGDGPGEEGVPGERADGSVRAQLDDGEQRPPQHPGRAAGVLRLP
ncbi:hypothetical protein AB0J71_49350 [Nonomuraea sp. NPDC049637]|uniref:hypothetical protein n=1 Tax=Nonomuraea sp. NPDC049637 TaxID=3154356 RepID=UPI003435B004